MKKIHLICKTHLDMGFTDFAETVMDRYRKEFIPTAISLAEKLNTNSSKKFIWTTGSWLIKDSLENAPKENKERLIKAIEQGDIAWHALPFTTHTEILDRDTFMYGMGISNELDKRFNRKTISAKMTDVPGHTKGIVKFLGEKEVKLLHIGVNEASAMPSLPQAFLWRYGGEEIVVLYEGTYGNIYKNPHIDDILYFIHSNDNHGPSNAQEIEEIYAQLKKDYPDYLITASTLDEYAKEIWKVREKLPVITDEIGDSWIHGVATDPYKTGAFKELLRLKKEWVKSGELSTDSKEFKDFSDNLLQVAEHTWGMDVKRHFSDFEHYLLTDFQKAKQNDRVRLRRNLNNLYHKRAIIKYINKGEYNRGSYNAMEKSWEEQRSYIKKAVASLSKERQDIAKERIEKLLPNNGFDTSGYASLELNKPYKLGDFSLVFGKNGLSSLDYKDKPLLKSKNSGIGTINYVAYSHKDYDFWKENYTRNYKTTREWSEPDFLRPGLEIYEGRYLEGRYPYTVKNVVGKGNAIILELTTDERLFTHQGAPKQVQIKYTAKGESLESEIIWLGKKANRLTEAVFYNLPLEVKKESVKFVKMGEEIDPYQIVENGNRNLSAVEEVRFDSGLGDSFAIENLHSPLVSIGKGKILEFDNIYQDIEKEGLSFNLYNNVWGTNFPLWYSDNAYFKFVLKKV